MYALAKVLGKQVTRQVQPAQWNSIRRRLRQIGCIAGLLVLGVSSNASLAAELSSAPAQPLPRPGELRLVIDAEPAHLNPLLDPDLWGYRIAHNLICEPLFRRRDDSPEQARAYEPVLADRYRLDSDGHGIEIWLRSGVRFHDGRPLTASDVRATLDMVRFAGATAPRTQALLADVLRVQVLSKEQLRIDFRSGPRGPKTRRDFILAALSEIDILPAGYFPSGRLIYQPWNRHPICTGPYRLSEWRRGNYISLRRYAGYWGPAPANDELRFRIATDGGQGLSLLRQGAADALLRVMPRYLSDQVEPAVQRGRFRKVETLANQVVVVVPNLRHPLLSQSAVRRALSLLWDRERLVREVRKGLAAALHLPDLEMPAARGSETAIASSNDSRTLQAQAEALLDQAGLLRLNRDGPRAYQMPAATPGGQSTLRPVRLHLLIPQGTTELQEVARRLSEWSAKLGIKIEIEPVDLPTFTFRVRRGAFELALGSWSWTGGSEDFTPGPLLGYALGPGPLKSGEGAAAFLGLREGSPAQQAAALTRLLAHFTEEAPLFLLYRPRQLMLLGPQVEPLHPARIGDFIDLRTLRLLAKTAPRSYESTLR